MLRGVIHAPHEISASSTFESRDVIDFSLQLDGLYVITYSKMIDNDDACPDTFDRFRP